MAEPQPAAVTDEQIRRYLVKDGRPGYLDVHLNDQWVWARDPTDLVWVVWCRHKFEAWIDGHVMTDPCDHNDQVYLLRLLMNRGAA